MSALTTFEEASAGVARLDFAFGGEACTEAQRFAELRLFRNSKPAHVEAALTRVLRYWVRRANADELRQLVEDEAAVAQCVKATAGNSPDRR
jgi:hypothetical protein